MDIWLTRTLSGLAPADDFAGNFLRKYKIGDTVKADVRKPRAHRSLRRYWALVRLCYSNSEQFKSEKQVHEFLKRRAGHATQIVSVKTGEIFEVADSIDYDSIEEEHEFQEIWQRVVQVVADDILGTGVPEIEMEIQRIIGIAA